jgi:hypothetical protein
MVKPWWIDGKSWCFDGMISEIKSMPLFSDFNFFRGSGMSERNSFYLERVESKIDPSARRVFLRRRASDVSG